MKSFSILAIFVATLSLALGEMFVPTIASAQSRQNVFPNSGYCPDGQKTKDLAKCKNKGSQQRHQGSQQPLEKAR